MHYCWSSARSKRGPSTSGVRGKVCVSRLLSRRSVADVPEELFGKDETCSWIKSKVRQCLEDDAGVVELVQHLECLPLAMGQVTAYARVHSTATVRTNRCEPRGVADKGELKVGGKVKVH